MQRLTTISENIWGAETTVPIGLGAHLPLRMTVLGSEHGLVLVSPISIDDQLAEQLAAMGEVSAIVGPNLLHYRFLAAAKARYSNAKLLGAPGLAAKRREICFDAEIARGALGHEIESLHIEGADKLSEVIFWHRPSRTLVMTDTIFNVGDASGMSWLVLKLLSGTLGRLEQSRLIRSLTKDRATAGSSVEAIFDWQIDRIVMAHGAVVESDENGTAAAKLRAGLWWWLGESRPRR